ncbi:hypothetical protein [Psychroflexus salis]|uniref:Uncharacterized protein n=1 Tax=Psychroflexus salis TaxID=1526574 RepID=A0A916ZVP2_9FLAO|nr:hypothetical protein [Psychroflexus salis]GGE15457.1 hypothetical protein GCM10010831_15980 [Psychroflexus salis]
MNEREWVKSIIEEIEKSLKPFNSNLRVTDGFRLPYASEILTYNDNEPEQQNFIGYETDILIFEQIDETRWKPRIIVEAKINSVTTHDAITYSQKAQTHKNVHPYLRYGILIGNRKDYPLPGRLFRHGQHFDFMMSWKSFKGDKSEWNTLIEILKSEYEASLTLDEIIFNSRSRDRKKFTSLHRPLKLKK